VKFKVAESKTFQQFRSDRGENWTQLMRRKPSKKEIAAWERRQQDYKDVKQILTHLAANLRRAANRGVAAKEIDVDLDYVYNIGASQDFLCALTGIELEFTRGGTYWGGKWCNPNSCTIDRIDNSKGYIPGNIQLVAWKPNCMRNHWPLDEMIDLCKDVARWHK
jgi:hypothetical protein